MVTDVNTELRVTPPAYSHHPPQLFGPLEPIESTCSRCARRWATGQPELGPQHDQLAAHGQAGIAHTSFGARFTPGLAGACYVARGFSTRASLRDKAAQVRLRLTIVLAGAKWNAPRARNVIQAGHATARHVASCSAPCVAALGPRCVSISSRLRGPAQQVR